MESLKLSSHPTENMPNIGSRAAPTHTEGNVGPTQYSFNPLARAFTPLLRATSENTPAPQWPLPNIPASYPIVSKDPVTVQSDEYSVWAYLRHFDILVANLIREVYSPEYQIPADSRSRFTGAIRANHTIEVVEAERRGSRRSAGSSCSIGAAPFQVQQTLRPFGTLSIGASSGIGKRQRNYRASSKGLLISADELEPHLVEAGYSGADEAQGQEDQVMVPKKQKFDLVLSESTRKADKNDVVDDLVRMWTLVDL